MCGILCIPITPEAHQALQPARWRGPDETVSTFAGEHVFIFSRLCVVGATEGHQPFRYDLQGQQVVAQTNGEIYNHRELRRRLKVHVETHPLPTCPYLAIPLEPSWSLSQMLDVANVDTRADCDIVAKTLLWWGPAATFAALHGEFATVVYVAGYLIAARDHYGVRPLFYGYDAAGQIIFASSLNQVTDPFYIPNCKPFPPSHFLVFEVATRTTLTLQRFVPDDQQPRPPANVQLDTPESHTLETHTPETYDARVASALYTACAMRYLQQEPYPAWEAYSPRDSPAKYSAHKTGVLLSGGTDSSVVTGLGVHTVGAQGVVAFTATFEEKPTQDVEQARALCQELGVEHHVMRLPQPTRDMVRACVRDIGTYDVTTVRAGLAQWLLCQQIRACMPLLKVLLCGEGADETAQGYQYVKLAPGPMEAAADAQRLLDEIYLFDGARVDRTTGRFGFEVRLPFLDTAFTSAFQAIPPEDRFDPRMEKAVLRRVLATTLANYVPALQGPVAQRIIQRPKEAFSDSVGSSWVRALQDLAKTSPTLVPRAQWATRFPFNTPQTEEALLYRQLFDEEFHGHYADHIPHMWMPKWCLPSVVDPSARVLSCYTGDCT